MLLSYFDYIFCALKAKSTFQARIKPEIFVKFRPEPDAKSPARVTTLPQAEKYLQAITSNRAFFLITKPTRVTNKSAMVIDHIITNHV